MPIVPTADDTPISNAASSELTPTAIAAQNRTRSCHTPLSADPATGLAPIQPHRAASRIVPINAFPSRCCDDHPESTLRPMSECATVWPLGGRRR
jgi:hypothetical protein